MQKVFEIIKGVGLYINFYKWKKKERKKKLEQKRRYLRLKGEE